MKNYIKLLILTAFIFLTYSCSTTRSLTIYGQPGTEIYKSNEHIGTVGSSGKTAIIIEDYQGFLLTKTPGSNEKIPFALDFKNDKHTGSFATAITLGYTVLLPFTLFTQLMAAITGLEGEAVTETVKAFGGDCYDYAFEHNAQQYTNEDIPLPSKK